jgi:hypothetical protein
MNTVFSEVSNNHLTVVPKNHFTLDEHVQRLVFARTKIREGFFEFVDALIVAQEQLPEHTFQNELASRLGMKKWTLSKWMQICNSEYLMTNREHFPSVFSSLYTITLIEKKYQIQYGNDCMDRLDKLLEHEVITSTSERSHIESVLQDIIQKIREDDSHRRQAAILSLSGGKLASQPASKTLQEYLSDKIRFRSFVIIPSESQISKWSNEGYFAYDIAEEFPLQDIRAPSMSKPLSCLIRIKMKHIETGLKLLNAWGFSYRDVLVPPVHKHCTILDGEYVLVRGERGKNRKIKTRTCSSFETEDVLAFAEKICDGPHLLVFNESGRDNWSCLPEQF